MLQWDHGRDPATGSVPIGSIEALSETEMDALLDNIFVTRRFGSFAYTSVRVFFSTARTFNVDSSVTFTTNKGITFIPVSAQIYSLADLTRSGTTLNGHTQPRIFSTS